MENTLTLFDTNAYVNYWEGIVVGRSEWPRTDTPIKSSEELNNWAYRVKVRIQGVHPADKSLLPDSQLPWIELPANPFGSGHRATGITPGITQGSIVWGIWAVPALRQRPIILGIKHNNEQTPLTRSQRSGFDPLSGFTSQDVVPGYAVPLTEGNPLEGIAFGNFWNQSDKGKMEEYVIPLKSPSPCTASPLSGIMMTMRKLIQQIEKIRSQIRTWGSAAQSWISEKQAYIQDLLQKAARKISEGIRWLIETIRKYTIEFVEDKIKKLMYNVNHSDRQAAKSAKDTAMQLLSCLFNKIINALLGMVLNMLKNALGRFINVPKCVVENLMGSLLGNLFGFLSGAIDKILQPISSIIGSVVSVADGILGAITSLIGFFACDDQMECPETTQWHIHNGGRAPITFDIQTIFDQAKSIAVDVKKIVDPENFTFNLPSIFSNVNSCFTGPILCGPPKVEFFGGGGKGAAANAIINGLGELMGVDIVSPGSGYTKPPFVNLVDDCGNGNGAVLRSVIGDPTTIGSITYGSPSGNTTKQGGSASFRVRVSGNPTSDVFIDLTLSDEMQAKISSGTQLLSKLTLAFSPDGTAYTKQQNFTRPIDVTVRKNGTKSADFIITLIGQNDGVPGDTSYTVNGSSRSKDPVFNGRTGSVQLKNIGTSSSGSTTNLPGGGTDREPTQTPLVPLPITPEQYVGIGSTNLPLAPDIPTEVGVIRVIVEESGFNYLTSPNGSLGGDGRLWATPEQFVVTRSDGTYDDPYDSEDQIEPPLSSGDKLSRPEDRIQTILTDGIVGGGRSTEFPTNGDGSYPVLLYLCDVIVERGGINYTMGDKVIIEPNSDGAILEPVIGPFGSVEKITIVSPGIGYTVRPNIYVESQTGYNAILIPVLCVNRIGDDTEGTISSNVKPADIIKVIDCVGTVDNS